MSRKAELGEVRHLGRGEIVNLGSFYTPGKFVEMAYGWLGEDLEGSVGEHDSGAAEGCGRGGAERKGRGGGDYVILDPSCGYGAFFAAPFDAAFGMDGQFKGCRFVGNDIDAEAVAKVREAFPGVETYCKNALANVARGEFGVSESEKLVVVGNPPYNDTTSQIGREVKTEVVEIDDDIRSRDLGISSLLAYNKLRADVCVILHPLSYLIKRANFRAAGRFFENYKLERHIVFSSAEFANTSKLSGFPIIMGFYRRRAGQGLRFEEVQDFQFRTVEGESFQISKRDYVANHISKYPSRKRYAPEILFYTMRDINALKRSRTFIAERIANAVDVDPEKLAYYCYIDCFKKYATVPYYLGNFDVPFIEDELEKVREAVMKVSKFEHREIFAGIFGECPRPTAEEERKVREYIEKVVSYR